MSLTQDQLDRLVKCPLFAGLGKGELVAVAGAARTADFAATEVVFREGDASRSAHVVLEGEIGIRTHILDGATGSLPFRPILVKLTAGEVFGELALIDSEPRSAEAFAVVASKLCVFDADWLAELAGRRPALAYRVVRNLTAMLVARLRETNDKLRGALEYGWRARGLDRL